VSEERGPVRGFWHAALLLFGSCLLLWLAVQLIASIWIWLLVAVSIGIVGWGVWLWWRSRRSRW
jgi:hypothetical protein